MTTYTTGKEKESIGKEVPATGKLMSGTGNRNTTTRNQRNAGKQDSTTYITTAPILSMSDIHLEQEEQQTQDKARTYNTNTGKNKSSKTTHSYYALFSQIKHMQTFLLTKIHAQLNLGTSHAIKNSLTYALVTQTYAYKNFKRCKNSKKHFFRCCVLWSPPYWQADKEFMTTCVGIQLVQKRIKIFSKPAITGNLQYTGKKAPITGNLQSTGKKVSILYIKAETSEDHPVLLQQQQVELHQNKEQGAIHSKDTGKNILLPIHFSFYALSRQINNTATTSILNTQKHEKYHKVDSYKNNLNTYIALLQLHPQKKLLEN